MPLQRWEKVSYQTRLGELNQAYDAVLAHADVLESAVDGGRKPPREWSNELWTIQRDYELYRGTEKRSEVQGAHALLSSSILELADAEKLYRSGAVGSVVQQRLDTIGQHLDSAGRSLGRRVENDDRSQ